VKIVSKKINGLLSKSRIIFKNFQACIGAAIPQVLLMMSELYWHSVHFHVEPYQLEFKNIVMAHYKN